MDSEDASQALIPRYHHTRLPPAPRPGPFSHCQRTFGLKCTARSCQPTSHPPGPEYPVTLERFEQQLKF